MLLILIVFSPAVHHTAFVLVWFYFNAHLLYVFFFSSHMPVTAQSCASPHLQ